MRTRQDIANLMIAHYNELHALREAGQKEYAHDESNAFRNFEDIAEKLKIPREKVLWTYLQKHLDGVIAYINGHKSQREDVLGRIDDIEVYLILLRGMIIDNRTNYKCEAIEYTQYNMVHHDKLR